MRASWRSTRTLILSSDATTSIMCVSWAASARRYGQLVDHALVHHGFVGRAVRAEELVVPAHTGFRHVLRNGVELALALVEVDECRMNSGACRTAGKAVWL
jgi:hypothetical protein